MFSHVSVHPSICPSTLGGGVPRPGPGGGEGTPARSSQRGYPCQTWPGGTLIGGIPPWVSSQIRPGGYPNRGYSTLGTPCQTWPGGTPPQVPPPHWTWLGVPHLRYHPLPIRSDQGGYLMGGVPHLIQIDGVEYLIRRGRYASCVHAGELSCLVAVLTLNRKRNVNQ